MVYIVLTTTDDASEAEEIGRQLVEENLAACTNVVPRINSAYRWKGEIEEAEEALLLAKTTENQLDDLKSKMKRLHSYETPEVLAISVEEGSDKYLRWLEKNVG